MIGPAMLTAAERVGVVQTASGHSISTGIWTLVVLATGAIGTAAAWWIRGMPERKRAANEGMSVEDAATARLIEGLTAEMARLQERVASQDRRITALESEVREGHDREAALRAENLGLKAVIQSRGEIRQRAAQIVAADRLAAEDEQNEREGEE